MYWRLGDLTLSDDGGWSKIICRVIGEQNAEPLPGHVEVRWDYHVPAAHAAEGGGEEVGSGISVSRAVDSAEGKGKGKVVEEEEDPFADESVLPPSSPPPFAKSKEWVKVPLVRRLVSGKYEAK